MTVVVAAGGYPASASTGDRIDGLNADGQIAGNAATVFHAGTDRTESGEWVTAGGRVLAVTALGDSIEHARGIAYEAIDHITFDGAQYRRDIAAERTT